MYDGFWPVSTSAALSRSIDAQAEHRLRAGMLAELNPRLSYGGRLWQRANVD